MTNAGTSHAGATAKPVRPLSGVTVLAIEHFIAGPLATMILADLGADVIKVELPEGDSYRNNPPVYNNEYGTTSYSFTRANRNKRSLSLDFRTDKGKELLLELVGKSDVLVENFRPGVLSKLGFGWDVLQATNSRLIYATVTGFGHSDVLPSPMGNLPAFDIIAQALSGIMWRPTKEGQPPTYLGIPLADEISGVMTAMGVLAALNLRNLTGQGTRVDLSMYDATVMLTESVITYWSHFKQEGSRGASSTSCPYDVFKAKDGYFVLGVAGEPIWQRFAKAIGRADLIDRPELRSGKDRAKVLETVVRPIIEDWASGRTKAETCAFFREGGIPAAPVQNVGDLFECPHIEARNMLLELDDPVIGKIAVAGNPLKFSAVPEVERNAPPQLGADSTDVLSDILGLDATTIASLQAAGIVKMAEGKKVGA
ncbi:CoA transferase [Chelativorans sp. AA-79]|uniref:CaiB/BaiF CoA transferase family protein n=1 Tax=Chelativorans sp. AA-79 TaxID=3028735 RepID=UPI0023FA08D2|nr:CoA transferase [Chelativorans sp. AA-79]WEX12450.1 CoA transferase [Chelativorans sp. AA-79]